MAAAEKTDHILDTSLAVFCRYGFSKTTMKDLADAAGISRATLYLHFSNKDDLFRAGSERAHATVMAEVEARLTDEGPVIERINRAMTAYLQGLMEKIHASPHGQEIFDSNLALSRDITQASRERMAERIADVLSEAARASEVRFTDIEATPSELARLILSTVDGVKAAGGTSGQISDSSSLFMRILGRAIAQQ